MTVAVVIPWDYAAPGPAYEPRAQALRFVVRWWEQHYPDLPYVLAADLHRPWTKAGAVTRGAHNCRYADTLIIADADVIPDPAAVSEMVELVESSTCAWAVPHEKVWRLNEASTQRVYEAGPGAMHVNPSCERTPYKGIAGGGITIIRREVYDDVPMDPRFQGWGGEDEAWGLALATLHGEPCRHPNAKLVHLWHPHAAPDRPRWRWPERQASTDLLIRYRKAGAARRGWPDPDAMRAIVDEYR